MGMTIARDGIVSSCSTGPSGLDSLDLKDLLLTEGMFVHDEVYKTFGPTHRILPDPLGCRLLLLPEGIVAHMANIGPTAPFHVTLSPDGSLRLLREG
jgi:hypothetical protein